MPHLFIVLALLWLAGAAMRIPLLVVPPIIPLIHDDLHMTETQVGALIGMPLIMFALAAVPGSLLIARFGVMLVAVAGLVHHGARRGRARRRVRHLDALCRHRADGLRRRHPAAGDADAGARLRAAPHVARHRDLHQRHDDRRDARADADHSAGAAAGRRQLAPRSSGLGGAGPGRGARLFRRCAPRTGDCGANRRRAAALVARLEQPADLAARPHARRQQCAVLRRQRLRAGLSHRHRPRRSDRHDARLAQRLAARRVVFPAGDEPKACNGKAGRSRSSARSPCWA